MAYIYSLAHPITNEIRYIGKTCNPLKQRLNEHIYECKRSRRRTTNWLKSLIKQDLIPIIEEIEECSCELACEIESYWINQFNQWGFNLTNHTMGGEGGYRYETPEENEIRRTKFRGVENPFYGKTHSDETKKKISEAGKGRKMPPSHIESCRKRMIGFKPSQKATDNMIKSHGRRIIQLDKHLNFIKEFYTIREAATSTNSSDSKITPVCQRKRHSHNGFIWMYKEDYENLSDEFRNFILQKVEKFKNYK